jgi:hypothetical protein
MKKLSLHILRSVLFVTLPAMLACGGSTDTVGRMSAGNYTATLFVTTDGTGQTNQLAAGSTLQINLASAGTTTGHLHLAASSANPVFDADMAGTWTEEGNVVELSQGADTFVQDLPLASGPDTNGKWTLTGDKVFSTTRIQLVLTRVP